MKPIPSRHVPSTLQVSVFTALLVILALAGGCSKNERTENSNEHLLTNNSSGNPLTAPVDYLGAVNQARKTALKTIDNASINNAIQQFHAVEDRYPKDLNELAQKRYIQSVPEPPPGTRFSYNPANGEFKIVRQ